MCCPAFCYLVGLLLTAFSILLALTLADHWNDNECYGCNCRKLSNGMTKVECPSTAVFLRYDDPSISSIEVDDSELVVRIAFSQFLQDVSVGHGASKSSFIVATLDIGLDAVDSRSRSAIIDRV